MAAINERLAPRLTPPQPRRVWSFLCHGGRSSLCKVGEISLACSLPVRPSFSRHSRHFLGRRAGPTPGRVDGLTARVEGFSFCSRAKYSSFKTAQALSPIHHSIHTGTDVATRVSLRPSIKP